MNREQKIAELKHQSEALQSQIGQVNARIKDLEQGSVVQKLIAYVDDDKCIGCGKCVSVCPVSAITIDNTIARIARDVCTGCGNCVSVCPQRAITLEAL